ncbi:MAG TPA: sugar kinase [Dysgonomonas sp.]|nr:sugar kinase [Dysgonomonas sp.]
MTIGVDLTSTSINAGLVEGGEIFRKIVEPFPYDKPLEETLDHIIGVIGKLMNSNIKGIGIGVPSVVDAKQGIVYNAVNVPSWKEVHLKEILEKEFGIPVNVNNDCNCFAFAERYYGEGTPYRNIVAVKLGSGLGAGIIINDELYDGWNTGAGEVGSLPYLDKDYEEYCAANFFRRYNTTGYIAYSRALKNDPEALSIWKEYGCHIGNLLKVILFTYDPQAIIIGGESSIAYNLFSDSMHNTLASFPYPETIKRINILLSNKENIGLLGAAALIP